MLVFSLSTQKLNRDLCPATTTTNNNNCAFTVPVYKSPEGPDLKAIGYYAGALEAMREKMTFSPSSDPCLTLEPIFTPGHSVDHMCLALAVNGTVECVFVGDLLLGELNHVGRRKWS